MTNHDWLGSYGNFDGLNRALSGMARRTPFYSNMETASEFLKNDYAFYQDSFNRFFPELISHSDKVRDEVIAEIR